MTAFLLLFVFASLAFVLIRESKGKAEVIPADGKNRTVVALPVQKDVLTVYYFHGNMRCKTCNQFEKLTREIVQTRFADSLASGKLILKIVNTDVPGNEHFVRDFQLTTKSIVLQKNGKYKNLERMWTLIRQSDGDLKTYIENEIKAMAEAK